MFPTTDLPHSPCIDPNLPHGQFYNRNTPLLADPVHNGCTSSNLTNTLLPPVELSLSRVSEEQLLASGNSAYLQAQLTIERQRRKIGELEIQIRDQEMDVMMWKTRFTSAQELLDKLIQSVPKTASSSNLLPISKDLPPSLDPKNYCDVQFWTAKAFETYSSNQMGETDGLATKQKSRGRRRKSDEGRNRHPYLETKDGTPIPRELLAMVGQKARRLWQALSTAGMAPSSWGKASDVAYRYFHSEMLNEPEFEFFRYCEGNWKITRWATKAYASWKHNHLKLSDAGEGKKQCTNKRKRQPLVSLDDPLDDPTLLQISDEAHEAPCEALGQAITFSDPLDDLYSEVDQNNTSSAISPEGNGAISPTTPAGPVAATTLPTPADTAVALTSSVPPPPSGVVIAPIPFVSPAPTTSPAIPEEESGQSCRTQDPGPSTIGMTSNAHSSLSMSSPQPVEASLASIGNNEVIGQSRASAKRVKLGPAVVGKGLTDKNFCMRDWLEQNPDGSKDAFEQHFKALTPDAKKKYKDLAAAAQKKARKEKKAVSATK